MTQFEGPARAYGAISAATSSNLFDIFISHPEYFIERNPQPTNKNDFTKTYSYPLRDFNTAGVVCAHMGNRLSAMKQGYYSVYNEEVKVNNNKILECIDAIDKIIQVL